eukprot:GILK01003003.1.p1 GENE.GILK01003003.1~~GILK01003003.1.p1  ORF type:complete len:299 (+),score=37.01 GILK01003003.1:83-979(+)
MASHSGQDDQNRIHRRELDELSGDESPHVDSDDDAESIESEGERKGYWCHVCAEEIDPITSEPELKCPNCESAFIEEIEEGEHPETFVPYGVEEHEDDEEDEQDDNNANSIPPADPFASFLSRMSQAMGGQPAHAPGEGSANQHPLNNLASLLSAMLAPQGNGLDILFNGAGTGLAGNVGDYGFGQSLEQLMAQIMANDPNRYGPPPASSSAVDALPEVRIEKRIESEIPVDCAVCKDEFSEGDTAKKMPCLHLFHPDCILPWLKDHNSCPVCRFELPTDDPDYEQRRNQRRQGTSSR